MLQTYIWDMTSLNLFQSISSSDFLCYLSAEASIVFRSGHAILESFSIYHLSFLPT